MARPLTALDVEAIAQESWDATLAEANVPWEELDGVTKSRYRDIATDACKYGGASGEFEVKCQELWVEKQESDPPEPEEPAQAEAAEEKEESILPPGTDLTPAVLAAAIRKLAGEGEEETPAPAEQPAPVEQPAQA